MATRCNVTLVGDETRLWLYRHYDGYPAACGASIAGVIKKNRIKYRYHRGLAQTAQALLDLKYDDENRRLYVITSCEHGDIDWRYHLRFTDTGDLFITVSERSRESWSGWISHGEMNEKDFRSFVAMNLLAMRARINERRRRFAA